MRSRAFNVCVTVLVLVLLAAACTAGSTTDPDRGGSTDSAPVASDQATTGAPTARRAVAYPTGSDELVLVVDTTGGNWDSDFELVDLPLLTLYGDGTMYRSLSPVLRPEDGNFGYPNANQIGRIRKVSLSPAQMADLFQLADSLGLLTKLSFGSGQISDIGSTVVSINLTGRSVRQQAEALSGGSESAGPGRTAAQNDARKALQTFLRQVWKLSRSGGKTYVPQAIIVNRMDPATPYAKPGAFGPPDSRDWPIKNIPPALKAGDERSCVVVEGDDVKPLLRALKKATVTTAWRTPDATMEWLQFRPAFPGGHNGC